MTDRQRKLSTRTKHPIDERGNPHGGHGRRVAHDIAEQFETQTGHPMGDRGEDTGESGITGAVPPKSEHIMHGQHARKGQAESPRELTLNQPPKKKEGHNG